MAECADERYIVLKYGKGNLVTVLFSYLVFHERLTKKSALGLAGIVAGTLLMLL